MHVPTEGDKAVLCHQHRHGPVLLHTKKFLDQMQLESQVVNLVALLEVVQEDLEVLEQHVVQEDLVAREQQEVQAVQEDLEAREQHVVQAVQEVLVTREQQVVQEDLEARDQHVVQEDPLALEQHVVELERRKGVTEVALGENGRHLVPVLVAKVQGRVKFQSLEEQLARRPVLWPRCVVLMDLHTCQNATCGRKYFFSF